jgi:glycine cleavage system H lipoate-binding protein
MLAAAFFVTVVVALAAYHILIERPRRVASRELQRRAPAGPVRLEDVVGPVPGGVFLQNGFTWSRVIPDGAVEVGVHPMLVGLVGEEPELVLDDPGCRVERGEPFMRIGQGERELQVPAPVTGRITARNHFPRTDLGWNELRDSDESWLYRVEPDDLARDVPSWMIGTQAADWTRNRYERIREHLQHAVAEGETGLALADGGAVPFGALDELDPEAWLKFEQAFLSN